MKADARLARESESNATPARIRSLVKKAGSAIAMRHQRDCLNLHVRGE